MLVKRFCIDPKTVARWRKHTAFRSVVRPKEAQINGPVHRGKRRWSSLSEDIRCFRWTRPTRAFQEEVRSVNAHSCERYNRRCAQLGVAPVFAEMDNPFRWISEADGFKKEKNFFETRVIEYQNGGSLTWD